MNEKVLRTSSIIIFFLSHEESPISGFSWSYSSNYGNIFGEYLVNIGINMVLFLSAFFYFKGLHLLLLWQVPFYLIIVLVALFPMYRIGKVKYCKMVA